MTVLVDKRLIELGQQGLITPFNLDQVNPASYDVTLGDEILVENFSYVGERWRTFNIKEKRFCLHPGEFVLAVTSEVVQIPNDVEAEFCLKSSRGREGYEHALAAYIDPGFSGRITLELKNNSRFHQLPLYPGMRIGQLRFTRLLEQPEKPYSITGRYNGDMKVTPSKG